MFVAYLVPKYDLHLVVEDGLGYLAIGNTREEAEANLHKQFVESLPHEDEQGLGEIRSDHVLHIAEVAR